MFVILFKYVNSDNPSNSWEVLPEAIYFDKEKAMRDANTLNHFNGPQYVYGAFELKEIK
jgi:hypothetical protein